MKKIFQTNTGFVERELTQTEINEFAAMGDISCKQDIAKKEFAASGQLQDKVNAIAKMLGLI